MEFWVLVKFLLPFQFNDLDSHYFIIFDKPIFLEKRNWYSLMKIKKTGVIITNIGTPEACSVSSVRRYLRRFLGDAAF